MKLLFADELNGKVNPKLFGICLVVLDATKYRLLRENFHKLLKKSNWDHSVEFKGRYLFSRDPAGQRKTPEEMITLTTQIIDWLKGESHQRGKIFCGYNTKGQSLDNYKYILNGLVKRIPRCVNQGKNLCFVYYDETSILSNLLDQQQFAIEISANLEMRKYLLAEKNIQPISSSNDSPGIIYADVLSHLCRWVIENPNQQELDVTDLIEDRPNTQKKASIVHDIINRLKTKVLISIE